MNPRIKTTIIALITVAIIVLGALKTMFSGADVPVAAVEAKVAPAVAPAPVVAEVPAVVDVPAPAVPADDAE
jgi:hypothetical protein